MSDRQKLKIRNPDTGKMVFAAKKRGLAVLAKFGKTLADVFPVPGTENVGHVPSVPELAVQVDMQNVFAAVGSEAVRMAVRARKQKSRGSAGKGRRGEEGGRKAAKGRRAGRGEGGGGGGGGGGDGGGGDRKGGKGRKGGGGETGRSGKGGRRGQNTRPSSAPAIRGILVRTTSAAEGGGGGSKKRRKKRKALRVTFSEEATAADEKKQEGSAEQAARDILKCILKGQSDRWAALKARNAKFMRDGFLVLVRACEESLETGKNTLVCKAARATVPAASAQTVLDILTALEKAGHFGAHRDPPQARVRKKQKTVSFK